MRTIRNAAIALAVVLSGTLAVAESGAQKTFDALKGLEGAWEGKNSQGQTLRVSFRSTAGGSALLNEIHGQGSHDMITMFHMDGDRVLMTHYCSAGNQPRMTATLSPDGKSVVFEFLDATNLASPEAGHMHHVVFTMPDGTHHTEEWTFVNHGKEIKEVFTLQRAN